MQRQAHHDMLPEQTNAEQSRHNFHVDLKETILRDLGPGNAKLFEQKAKPAFEAAKGRAPENRHDVNSVMKEQSFTKFWNALARAQQELYVDSTTACVERQTAGLAARAKEIAAEAKLGSLALDPALELPRYMSAVDIHCIPGGYGLELVPDDIYAGARYDIGVYMYAMGKHGAFNEAKGVSGARFIKETYPDLKPKRILDLGCTAGGSTLPYGEAFPDAEVHGIDVSAPCLRYAHARAESLGQEVHFSQQNAEHTKFDAGSFDLIVSHILMHETSRKATYNIMAEGFRLLSPGGVMLHVEVPCRHSDMTPYQQWVMDWSTFNNNEPFWGTLHDMDIKAPIRAAGFPEDHIFDVDLDASFGNFMNGGAWWGFGAQKPK